jgi:drug/metabolite transporter (DMT)-like permease
MQMVSGGALLVLAGTAAGEWDRLALEKISIESCIAFIYLILFGSLVGFTAYIWLLGVVAPARVATYAYVNPIVAVLLGALMAGEPLTPRTLLAAAVIVGGVVAITTERASASETGQEPAAQPEVELSRN